MDREKVIKEAEQTLSFVLPDDKDTSGIMVRVGWIRDILALLKEQEPVEPTRVNTNYEQHWNCGNCNAVISGWDKFCHECGQKVKWE